MVNPWAGHDAKPRMHSTGGAAAAAAEVREPRLEQTQFRIPGVGIADLQGSCKGNAHMLSTAHDLTVGVLLGLSTGMVLVCDAPDTCVAF